MKLYLLAAIISYCVCFILCLFWIPLLRRWKAGQNILSYVKEHKKKNGTPTMGGFAFIVAAVFSSVFFVHELDRRYLLTIVIGISYMCIGLLDDFMKMKRKENLGLRAWQKFAFQAVVAILAGIYCYRAGLTELHIPFADKTISIGWGVLPLSVFIFIATVNAVNLTDGLDGLASAASIPFFLTVGALIIFQQGSNTLSLVAFCLVGALLAYLIFNVSPASVFMGDTGSLSLGGFVACIAVFSGNALYVAVIGAVFVFSVISVIVQVIYYKATKGKRIFLMAPAHHHFQMKGKSESQIAYAYFCITLILGALCLLTEL